MKVAVYGLGHLGAPLASVMSRAGHQVVGIDTNPEVLNRILAGEFSPYEPDVVFGDVVDVSKEPVPGDVSFIVVPTPSLDHGDRRGGFDSTHIETVLRHVAKVNDEGHIAVVTSTVSPGTCDRLAEAFPTLSIVYNPTFIALGRVVEGLTNPDLVLIGGRSAQDTGTVADLWRDVFDHFGTGGATWSRHAKVHRASYTEIELIKLSVNCALATKISLANSLGELFRAWGVDPAAVEIVGKDPRIGSAMMRPGSPVTGPCLPRDNRALTHAAAVKGLNMPISVATDRVNEQLLTRLLQRVLEHEPGAVGILGMTYKYGVDVDTAAPGPWLYERLRARGIPCFTYDEFLPDDTLEEVLSVSDVIVVTQAEYKHLVRGTSAAVVDLWA